MIDDEEYLKAGILINQIRSDLIALDILLRAGHNRRHPLPRDPFEAERMKPTQPLDPETRAEIDATP